MYRSLIFVALFVAITEGCQPPPCHWSNAKPIENYYDQVVNLMIAADRKIQNHCTQLGNAAIKEDHKPKEYKLIYPSVDGDSFEIKVKNRVILVRAENCIGSVADVRVLPAYVQPRGAYYTVEAGELIITFQYKFDPAMGGGVCIPPDPTVITIPRGSTNTPCTDCNKNIWSSK